MEKRAIVALVLSLVVLVGYQFIASKYYPSKTAIQEQQDVVHEKVAIPTESTKAEETPKAIYPEGKDIVFQNDLYNIIFSDVGAGIKSITLNRNPKHGLNMPFTLIDVKGPDAGICEFYPDNFGVTANSARYDVKKLTDGMIFTARLSDGTVIEKTYIVHNTLYRIDLELNIKNIRDIDSIKKYSLVSGIYEPVPQQDDRLFEISAAIDNKTAKYKRRAKQFEVQKSDIPSWIMLKNRYFSIIVKPFDQAAGYFVKENVNGTISTGVNMREITLSPNSSVTQKFGLFIGPSDLGLAKDANIGVEGALSYGVFGSISQLMISMLRLFHKIFRNWGVATILLSVVINMLLLPLTIKSYKSMHEMQLLQPKIEKLRQEHKSNPQKLQKEIMELYKKYKINPMGGCLPLLLQMPIFIALYNGLLNSIDLRGTGFLWIKDLSTPENIKLAFSLPLIGNTINILPLVMLVAMFIQQKLTNKFTSMSQTDEQRQQQKIMTVVMTAMFGFIFYNFPSALVLYWLTNTVIMIVYQMVFTKTPAQLVEHA